ncbi:MAG: hypothetical protein JNJ83_02915 [Verrucomicrobiaceae bacterium]|nr:hypothetical protein [Verrucomicrobiaceae bacterium]
MTEGESEVARKSQEWRLAKVVLKLLGWLFVAALLEALCGLTSFVVKVPLRLLYGWVPFLMSVVPSMTVRWEMVGLSLLSLSLAMWGATRLLAPKWRHWRVVGAGALFLIVLFATSIAAVGIVHQVGWLFRSGPWVEYSFSQNNDFRLIRVMRSVIAQAEENEGQFPDGLPYEPSNSAKRHRMQRVGETVFPFVYLGNGLTLSDPKDLPLFLSAVPESSGRWLMATLKGEVKHIEHAEREAAIMKLREFWLDNRERYKHLNEPGK